ncbi:unnamed protein product [Aspergillus oryzae var. brunneus]|uniref:Unnamed protein product n=1 Tax=Aspergillus oryzae var. brunneus TaxID=332754 RepID=A0ABQ6KC48_ASPOZ|nr:unnamed protein product [Aspergillus oryzae var. brunneus]
MLLPSCSNDKGGGLESDQSDQSVEGPNQPTKVEVRAPVSRYIPEIEKTTKRILTSLQCLEPIIDYGNTVTGTSVRALDSDRLRAGVELLKLIYDFPIYDVLVRKLYSKKAIVVVPMVITDAIVESIRSAFDNLDIGSDIEAQFQALVYQISHNTSRPLTIHRSMTVDDYCASFTGKSLRWESLGIVLSISGISLMSTSDNDPDLVQAAPSSEARERLRAQIVEASSICLNFCDQASSINELLGFAQYNDIMLKTQHFGDTSDLSATVYAAGFHQENTQADDCPFFLQQWRKICFASAFYADKAIATFVGRPPFINYRYCSLTPPMDLHEDILVAGGDDLANAISSLNMEGWNTQRQHYRTSMIRLRFIFSVYRDQALEIALGTCEDWDLVQKSNASVLTLELLHQTQEIGPHSVMLPRAEIIRNLSVFLSCLSWVPRPTYGNYQTCKEAEKKLSHILDQIIDPQPIQRDVFNDVTSGLDSFLDWYNPSNWDFNTDFLSSSDGFGLARD